MFVFIAFMFMSCFVVNSRKVSIVIVPMCIWSGLILSFCFIVLIRILLLSIYLLSCQSCSFCCSSSPSCWCVHFPPVFLSFHCAKFCFSWTLDYFCFFIIGGLVLFRFVKIGEDFWIGEDIDRPDAVVMERITRSHLSWNMRWPRTTESKNMAGTETKSFIGVQLGLALNASDDFPFIISANSQHEFKWQRHLLWD